MVRKIPSIKRPVKFLKAGALHRRLYPAVFIAATAILVHLPAAKAGSPASKNREGNRLYEAGEYEEAEKAYLEAQVDDPGKPEILYNLGNSLIKQGKYPQGIQSLQQSADKGDKQLKTDSLYNTGYALYSMDNYKGSAEAFIEALKLNPGDRDAKHNLELALRKLKEQEQKQDANREEKKQSDQKDTESKENKGEQSQPKSQERKSSGTESDQEKPAKMKPEPAVPREGSMTREQAQQILDAVRNQEIDQQRKLIESRSRPQGNERDW